MNFWYNKTNMDCSHWAMSRFIVSWFTLHCPWPSHYSMILHIYLPRSFKVLGITFCPAKCGAINLTMLSILAHSDRAAHQLHSCSQTATTNKLTTTFSQARCPSCCPTNSVNALKRNIIIFHQLHLSAQNHLIVSNHVWPLTATWGGLPCQYSISLAGEAVWYHTEGCCIVAAIPAQSLFSSVYTKQFIDII